MNAATDAQTWHMHVYVYVRTCVEEEKERHLDGEYEQSV